MTASVQKILGRFVYQAEVVPKRSRQPRRMDLWALAEYEIATVGEDDIAHDAITVQPQLDRAGHAGGVPLSLAAHDGLLWSPMKPIEHGGEMRNFAHLPGVRVDDYLAQFRGEFQHAWSCDDPILASYDSRAGTNDGRLPAPDTLREDDFVGEIVRSNRTETAMRHACAARDVLFVGDHVYARRPEPTWSVSPTLSLPDYPRERGGIQLTGLVSYNMQQRFRLDRLADAIAWLDFADPNCSKRAHGEIFSADLSLLRRNDLACMVADVLPSVLHGMAALAIPHLPDDAVQAWQTLNKLARSAAIGTFRDDRITHEPAGTLDALRVLAEALRSPSLPSHLDRHISEACGHVDQVLKRTDFELRRRPNLARVDELALSEMGAAP
jgi:hypothetical protein